MRKSFFAFILSLFYLNSSAQDEIKLFLDANFNQVEKKKDAVVLRNVIVKNNHFIIEDQYVKNGIMINYGEFISIDPLIEDGLSKHYEADKLYSMGNYKNGNLTGKWIYAKDNGYDTVDYSATELYLREVKDTCNYETMVDSTSLISETKKFKQFFKQNAYFPARARGTSDYQNCIFEFKIDTNGLIRCPKILNCSNVDISFELLRVALLYKNEYKKFASISLQDPFYDESEPAFVFVEEQALFQGGNLENFRLWVQNNLIYPEDAQKKSIYGRITVQFEVNSRGYITDIKIIRGVESSLDKEAYRVIMSSPRWQPAKQHGVNVKQQFVMPVIFMINENSTDTKGILIQEKVK